MSKRINLGRNIKKFVEPLLKGNGYEFLGNDGSDSWIFVKKDERQKMISFQKSINVKNAFAVLLETNKKPIKPPVNLIRFDKEQSSNYWWEYDEDTIENILFHVSQLIIEYGIPYLNEVSTPDLEPPKDLFSSIIKNAENLAKEFNNEIGILDTQSEYIKTVRDKLLERMKSYSSPDWNLILKASAAIGEYIIQKHGGKWDWSKQNPNISGVINIGEKKKSVSPLLWVSHFWGKPYVYGYDLTDKYIRFLTKLYGGRSKIKNI